MTKGRHIGLDISDPGNGMHCRQPSPSLTEAKAARAALKSKATKSSHNNELGGGPLALMKGDTAKK